MNCPLCGVAATAHETVCSFCGTSLREDRLREGGLREDGNVRAPQGNNPFQSPTLPGYVAAPVGDSESSAMLRMLLPVDRSLLAIVAGYLGLISVMCFPAPIAVIVGALAIRDIKLHPKKHGMGRAVFGLVMGLIFSSILGFFLVASLFSKR